MSPKCRTPQTLVALRLKALFFSIWHSALKRGVVVAPQILDFFFEKIPQISLTFKTKKDPFRSFFRYQGSLQPEAEGSPTPDTLPCPLSYPFPVALRIKRYTPPTVSLRRLNLIISHVSSFDTCSST